MYRFTTAVILFAASISPAFADITDGCVNSPEGPTALLALLGVVAAVRRERRRKAERQQASAV